MENGRSTDDEEIAEDVEQIRLFQDDFELGDLFDSVADRDSDEEDNTVEFLDTTDFNDSCRISVSGVENESIVTFTAYDYQTELFERCKRENCLIALATGSGKTFIAIMLIRHMAATTDPRFSQGGKRTVFLANTVPLVSQQYEQIKAHTNLRIKSFVGNDKLDIWNTDKWRKELETLQVIVMTPAILNLIFVSEAILMTDINLLIFDECHHTSGGHPYNSIMQRYKPAEGEMPRILGLSASIVSSKVKPGQFYAEVRGLETRLFSKAVIGTLNYNHKRQLTETCILYDDKKNEATHGVSIGDLLKNRLQQFVCEINKTTEDAKQLAEERTNQVFQEVKKIKDFERVKHVMKIDKLVYLAHLSNPNLPPSHSDIKKLCTGTMIALDELGVFPTLRAFKDMIENNNRTMRRLFFLHHQFYSPTETTLLSRFHSLIRDITDSYMVRAETGSDHVGLKRDKCSEQMNTLTKAILDNYRTHNSTLANGDSQHIPFHAIIFVKTRFVGMTLTCYLNYIRQNVAEYAFLRPEFICGQSANIGGMTTNQQRQIINRFRKKATNVLVATSVVEEGLDIPTCNHIFSFGLPLNPVAYIQIKGRTRTLRSTYTILIAQSKETKASSTLQNFKEIEQMLSTSITDVDSCMMRPSHHDKKYIDETISFNGKHMLRRNCVLLVYLYCQNLSKDSFNSRPCMSIAETDRTEVIDENGKIITIRQYRGLLILPRNSSVNKPIIGSIHRSKIAAKADVCFEALQELVAVGALDDRLLPIACEWRKQRLEREKQNLHINKAIYTSMYPTVFADSSLTAYLYCWLMESHSIGLLLFRQLPETPSFRIYNSMKQPIDSTLNFIKSFPVDVPLIAMFSAYHCRTYPIKKIQQVDSLDADKFHVNWMLCPLLPDLTDVDMDQVRSEKICDMREGALVKRSYARPDELLIVQELDTGVYANDVMTDTTKTYAEHFRVQYNIKLKEPNEPLIKVVYFRSSSYQPHLSSTDIARTRMKHHLYLPKEVVTVVDYIKPEIIQFAQAAPCLLHHLARFVMMHALGTQLLDKCEISVEARKVHPELCCCCWPVHANGKMVSGKAVGEERLPLGRIDLILIKKSSKVFNIDFQYLLMMINVATTMKSTASADDLERLELLGDSFLKIFSTILCSTEYAAVDESHLSEYRTRLVSNSHLFTQATKLSLASYIRQGRYHFPCPMIEGDLFNLPGMFTPACQELHNRDEVGKMKLGGKRLSDVVEALIAVFLLCDGYEFVYCFMEKVLGMKVSPDKHIVRGTCEPDSVEKQWKKMCLDKLQTDIGYTFKDKTLLIEACTHPTGYDNFVTSGYDRLEFIGDAVLDFLITRHIFFQRKDFNSGDLSILRSSLVNNRILAVLSIEAKFYKYLYYNSCDLYNAIDKFKNDVADETDENGKVNYERILSLFSKWPKSLADLVESVIGAVFVDSECDLQLTWELIKRIYGVVLESFIVDIPKNPILRIHSLQNIQQLDFEKSCREMDDGLVEYSWTYKLKNVMSCTCTHHDLYTARCQSAMHALARLQTLGLITKTDVGTIGVRQDSQTEENKR